MNDSQPTENQPIKKFEFDKLYERHWLAWILRFLAVCSVIYALSGFANDISELESEGRFIYGFSSALTMAVFAQIISYLQDLVKHAEYRTQKES